MKTINYLSYYAQPGNPDKRAVTLSSNNKIDYISDTIVKNDFNKTTYS